VRGCFSIVVGIVGAAKPLISRWVAVPVKAAESTFLDRLVALLVPMPIPIQSPKDAKTDLPVSRSDDITIVMGTTTGL